VSAVTGTFSQIKVSASGGTAGVVRAGMDRVEICEFRRTVEVAGDAFVERIFTPMEIAYCAGRIERLATRFAAKEAAAKVLGTGIRALGWHEVEVITAAHGEPHLLLRDRAFDRAGLLGVTSMSVSLTHTAIAAEAFVVAMCTALDAEQWIREETSNV
jgi:holo-[acyl-carrier protein] synthase